MNRIAGFIIPVALMIGFQFYQKGDARADVKQELIEVCEYEGVCTQTVNLYFEGCFERAYTNGTKRRAAVLDMNKLLICLNLSAGEEIFGVERVD